MATFAGSRASQCGVYRLVHELANNGGVVAPRQMPLPLPAVQGLPWRAYYIASCRTQITQNTIQHYIQ